MTSLARLLISAAEACLGSRMAAILSKRRPRFSLKQGDLRNPGTHTMCHCSGEGQSTFAPLGPVLLDEALVEKYHSDVDATPLYKFLKFLSSLRALGRQGARAAGSMRARAPPAPNPTAARRDGCARRAHACRGNLMAGPRHPRRPRRVGRIGKRAPYRLGLADLSAASTIRAALLLSPAPVPGTLAHQPNHDVAEAPLAREVVRPVDPGRPHA